MRYLSGGLFHQNKFPVKIIGPNLFFLWLLVFYYLTETFVLVLFMSSASHPHLLCRSSRLQMFFKIGASKNFEHFTGKHRFTERLPWLLLSIFPFMNVSSYTSPLPHSRFFFTVLLLSSFEKHFRLYITTTT